MKVGIYFFFVLANSEFTPLDMIILKACEYTAVILNFKYRSYIILNK